VVAIFFAPFYAINKQKIKKLLTIFILQRKTPFFENHPLRPLKIRAKNLHFFATFLHFLCNVHTISKLNQLLTIDENTALRRPRRETPIAQIKNLLYLCNPFSSL